MVYEVLALMVGVAAIYWSYLEARADGSWSWRLIVGFFMALAVFGAGYMWPMMNSKWLEAHPDAFAWVIFGPGAVLVGAFYLIAMRVQKARAGADD